MVKKINNQRSSSWLSTHSIVTGIKWGCVLFITVLAYRAGWGWLALYGGMSLITLIAYGVDKRAACRQQWRIPENSLHVLELACGWPGALLAQTVLRHKTQKQPFKSILWGMMIINISGFTVFYFY